MARIEPGVGSIPVTGTDNFSVLDELNVLGRIRNPSGSLLLSSSISDIVLSGNVSVLGNFSATESPAITGSDNFFVKNVLDVGRVISPSGSMVLSSSVSEVVLSGNLTIVGGGSVNVGGAFTIGGDVTYVSSSNLIVEDPLIVLAQSQSGAPQFDAGIVIERGSGENRAFIWRESESQFATVTTDETGSSAGSITIKGYAPLKTKEIFLQSGSVTAQESHLILSSSAGSFVVVSGSLLVTDPSSIVTRGIIYNDSGDLILSSSESFVALSGNLRTSNVSGPAIYDRASSTTVPTIIPRASLTASGLGADAAGVVSIISNATETIRVHDTAVNVNPTLSYKISVNPIGSTSGAKLRGDIAPTNILPTIFPNALGSTTGIGAEATGNMSFISNAVEVARVETDSFKVLGSGTLLLSGSEGRSEITTQNSHLILSSSVGVVVSSSFTVSRATTIFQTPNGSNILFITDGTVFLSSGAAINSQGGSGFISSTGKLRLAATNREIVMTGSVDLSKDDILKSSDSHLIFSSSAGSVVAVSASQDFVNDDKNYHIRSVNSHLILSSSKSGSVVMVSGTLSSSQGARFADIKLATGFIGSDSSVSIRTAGSQLAFQPLSTNAFFINLQRLFANTANGPSLENTTPTAIVPTLIPNRSDTKTGIGYADQDQLSLVVSGSEAIGISSSSVGITNRFSGTIDFPIDNRSYHIRSVNSDLILSSSVGKITLSGNAEIGNLTVTSAAGNGNVTVGAKSFGTIFIPNAINIQSTGGVTISAAGSFNIANADGKFTQAGHLILSSAVGSVVTASGSLLVEGPNLITRGGIYNDESHLILSSSVGSTIALSASALKLVGGLSSSPATLTHTVSGILQIGAAAGITLANSVTTAGTFHIFQGSGGRSIRTNSLSGTPILDGTNVHLILSCSAGSVVAVSASQDFVNDDKDYHIRSVNSDLILSSSAGSAVALSSSLLMKGNQIVLNADGDTILSSPSNDLFQVTINGANRFSVGAAGVSLVSHTFNVASVYCGGQLFYGNHYRLLNKSSNSSLAVQGDAFSIVTNSGSTDSIGITLPNISASNNPHTGTSFKFLVVESLPLSISASSGQTIRVGNNETTQGGNITENTVGSVIELTSINNMNWFATYSSGSWVVV